MLAKCGASLTALVVLCSTIVHGAPGDVFDESPPALHFALKRRGGAFAHNRTADLELLSRQLLEAESRFNYTQREVKGNKVVRAPKTKNMGGEETSSLMQGIGKVGNW